MLLKSAVICYGYGYGWLAQRTVKYRGKHSYLQVLK